MAESDTHYNGTSDMNTQMDNGEMRANDNYGLTTPLPEYGEGGPADSGNGANSPAVPLPNPGEGGPVYPGNGGNMPTVPLPDVGEGGPVNPGDGSNIPVVPLPNPGEGGPVYPGDGSNVPVIPLPNPGEGGPVGPGPVIPGPGWLPDFPPFPGISPQNYGQVRFLNASTNAFPVNISIDGTAYAINSRFGTISNYDWVSDGFHTVTVRRASGMRSILLQQNFPFVAGQKVTLVLTDSASGGLDMVRVIDTGCSNMPYNSGCYRFANMAYSGSRFDLLLYGGETVFRNVGFQTVTPYKQAMAGSYQFYVTNSNTYAFLRELPIIIVGAIGTTANIQQPLVSFQADINARQNYTTYMIGNTWSDTGLVAFTVED